MEVPLSQVTEIPAALPEKLGLAPVPEDGRDVGDLDWRGTVDWMAPKDVLELRGEPGVRLFHGTSTALLPSIYERGLICGQRRSNLTGAVMTLRSPTVYLTAKPSGPASAETYAFGAVAKHGGRPVILTVSVPGDRLWPDMDEVDGFARRYQYSVEVVYPQEIVAENWRERSREMTGGPGSVEKAARDKRGRLIPGMTMYVAERGSDNPGRLPPKTAAAMTAMKAVIADSAFAKHAQALDDGRAEAYWTGPTEMFARCFESWAHDTLKAAGRKNLHLVQGTDMVHATGVMITADVRQHPDYVKALADREKVVENLRKVIAEETAKFAPRASTNLTFWGPSDDVFNKVVRQSTRAADALKAYHKANGDAAATKRRLESEIGPTEAQPYPMGEERARITAAVGAVVAAAKEDGILGKILKAFLAGMGFSTPTDLVKSASSRIAFGVELDARLGEMLWKAARTHKYIRRVPKPGGGWRYYYHDAATAHAAQEGERINLRRHGVADVVKVGEDGTVTLRDPKSGKERTLPLTDLHDELHTVYRDRMERGAETIARQLLAAAGTVPEGAHDSAEAMWKAYGDRFKAAGVDLNHAKALVGFLAQRPGWSGDAKAVMLALATHATTGREVTGAGRQIARGAENLRRTARAEQVEPAHVVEAASSRRAIDELRPAAAADLGKLEGLLGAVEALGKNESAVKQLLAYTRQAVESPALARLQAAAEAYPDLGKVDELERYRELQSKWHALTKHSGDEGHPGQGAATTVYVADADGSPTPQAARYRLMEASDLIASHDPTKGFKPREEYPEGVQERVYHRDKAEQEKVLRNAQKLKPDLVANTNPDAVNGPPLITNKGIVLGGNSSTMSLQIAHEKGGEAQAAYVKHLRDNAHQWGLAPEDVAKFKQPVLVREVDVEDQGKQNLGVLVRRYNEAFTQSMDPRTDQVARARLVTPAMLQTLSAGMEAKTDNGEDKHATLNAYLTSPDSRPFVDAMQRAGIIDRRNRSQYLGKDGALNEDGKTFVERLLVGKVVPHADTLSDMPQSQIQAIARSVPHIVRAGSAGHDLSTPLVEAVQAHAYMRKHNLKNMGEFERDQGFGDLLGGDSGGFGAKPKVSPEGMHLLNLITTRTGHVQMSDAFRKVAQHAQRNPAGQTSMLGPPKTTAQVLEDMLGSEKSGGKQQTALFAGSSSARVDLIKAVSRALVGGAPRRPFHEVAKAASRKARTKAADMKAAAEASGYKDPKHFQRHMQLERWIDGNRRTAETLRALPKGATITVNGEAHDARKLLDEVEARQREHEGLLEEHKREHQELDTSFADVDPIAPVAPDAAVKPPRRSKKAKEDKARETTGIGTGERPSRATALAAATKMKEKLGDIRNLPAQFRDELTEEDIAKIEEGVPKAQRLDAGEKKSTKKKQADPMEPQTSAPDAPPDPEQERKRMEEGAALRKQILAEAAEAVKKEREASPEAAPAATKPEKKNEPKPASEPQATAPPKAEAPAEPEKPESIPTPPGFGEAKPAAAVPEGATQRTGDAAHDMLRRRASSAASNRASFDRLRSTLSNKSASKEARRAAYLDFVRGVADGSITAEHLESWGIKRKVAEQEIARAQGIHEQIQAFEKEHAETVEVGTETRGGERPTGAGWEPIPGGAHGGMRKRNGLKYDYWYP